MPTKEGLKKTRTNNSLWTVLTGNLKTYAPVFVFGFFTAFAVRKGLGLGEFLGNFLIASFLLVVFYRDILRYKPQYVRNNRMLVLLGLMVVGTLFAGRTSEYILGGLSEGFKAPAGASVFGLPVAAGAMLVTLLFDFHTALLFSFVVSMLTGLWLSDAAIGVYAFVGCLMAAFSVIRCKKRTAILIGGIYLLAANLVMAATVLLFEGSLFTLKAPAALIFATFSAFSVIAIVSLMLPLFEYLFKVTTDISLLELLDLEQPLMKSLMITAPGTYHHSIIVGNLVEAVADSVGINPLLARVAAYYHDIGKIKMPEYFIENQSGGVSKHEKLTPHMSSMILISHVKEGEELAKEHKLPETVTDIIKQHHGTSLITYFYEKAKEKPGAELSEDEYRYPGPKPQTRTSALLMMADAVEAASRVLVEPTPARISALVDRIINHIFLTGQLDECELTLKDIYEIKRRFTHILTGIFHRRVDYPGFDFGADESQRKQPPKNGAKEDKAKYQADREGLPESPQPVAASKGRA